MRSSHDSGESMPQINRTTTIEELVEPVLGVVPYLIERGFPCIVSGEPMGGSLEEMARDKGRSAEEIEALVTDMNKKLGVRPS
jgi:hypothetical protein